MQTELKGGATDPSDAALLMTYLERVSRETYLLLAGLRRRSQLGALLVEFAEIAERPRLLAERERLHSNCDPEGRLRARLRLQARGRAYLAFASRELEDRLLDRELNQEVVLDGEHIPLQLMPSWLRNTAERSRRRMLGLACERKRLEMAADVEKIWRIRYSLMSSLGYQSYAESWAEWKDLDLDQVARLALVGLKATTASFRKGLALWSEKMAGVLETDLSRFDLPRVERGHPWDQWFPSERLESFLLEFLASFGENRTTGRLHLDLAVRPGKSSRPFCVGIRIPEEVLLVAKPSGGHRDFEETLHEAGHALHFLATDPERPWEIRQLIDDGTAEPFAYLTAGVLCNPAFLACRLGVPAAEAEHFAAYAQFLELSLFRRYCAKALYEIELHRSMAIERSADLYAKWIWEACGVEVLGELGLSETDDGLYAAEYLLAWYREGSLRHILEEEFGDAWFAEPGAIERLRGWWYCGVGTPWREFGLELAEDHPERALRREWMLPD